MRPWQVILLVIVLGFFALSSGWKVLYLLFYVLLTLFVLSWLWARYSLRKLTFRRTTTSGRVQVGEMFDERLAQTKSWCYRMCCPLLALRSLQVACQVGGKVHGVLCRPRPMPRPFVIMLPGTQ